MRDDLRARLKQAQDQIQSSQAALKQLTDAPQRAQYLQNEIAKRVGELRASLNDEEKEEIKVRLAELSPTKGTLSAVVNMPSDDWQEYQFLLKLF